MNKLNIVTDHTFKGVVFLLIIMNDLCMNLVVLLDSYNIYVYDVSVCAYIVWVFLLIMEVRVCELKYFSAENL